MFIALSGVTPAVLGQSLTSGIYLKPGAFIIQCYFYVVFIFNYFY